MGVYAGPVIDAHHHFWEPRLGRQPWLRPGVLIPFRYGDYSAIKQDYLPPHLREDAERAGIDLVGTVTMETEWELDGPVEEMEYTQGIKDRYGFPSASVAHARLADPRVEGVLERLAELPLVRGVRNKPAPGAGSMPDTRRSLLSDPQWRKGYRLLAKYGLSFDLQVAWWHLDEAIELMREQDDIPVVLNHTGLPADRAPEALAAWEAAITRFAELEHVAIKVSGLGLANRPWLIEENGPIIERAIEAFGTDRSMFASNFPVDGLCGDYATIYGGYLEVTRSWSEADRRAVFAGTAVRMYGLDPGLLRGSEANSA